MRSGSGGPCREFVSSYACGICTSCDSKEQKQRLYLRLWYEWDLQTFSGNLGEIFMQKKEGLMSCVAAIKISRTHVSSKCKIELYICDRAWNRSRADESKKVIPPKWNRLGVFDSARFCLEQKVAFERTFINYFVSGNFVLWNFCDGEELDNEAISQHPRADTLHATWLRNLSSTVKRLAREDVSFSTVFLPGNVNGVFFFVQKIFRLIKKVLQIFVTSWTRVEVVKYREIWLKLSQCKCVSSATSAHYHTIYTSDMGSCVDSYRSA